MRKGPLSLPHPLTGTIALFGLAFVAACGGDDTIAKRIGGVYQSAACEPTPAGSFWRRYYEFTKNAWNLMTEVYTDDKCTQKVLSLEVAGELSVPADTPAAASGAEAIDLKVSYRAATPWQTANATALNGISCGGAKDWTSGIRKDTASGCGTISPSIAECPTIYEAAMVNEVQLMLGPATKTATDLCKPEARPMMLGAPLTRK